MSEMQKTIRSKDTVGDLFAALDRLVSGNTIYVGEIYLINKRTVCREAGRDTSTIKNTTQFAELRRAIDAAALRYNEGREKSSAGSRARKKKRGTSRRIRRLQDRIDELDQALDYSTDLIYSLYRRLAELEEDQTVLIDKLDKAQQSNSAIRRSFKLLGIQRIIEETIDTRADEC